MSRTLIKLDKGISPVISATILIATVIILGITFMTYATSLSNMQSSEARLRNMILDETAKVVMYFEKVSTTDNIIEIYLGLTKVIPEANTYYLILFKTYDYGSVYDLSPLSVSNVSQILPQPPRNILPDTLPATKTYVVETTGNYVPLNILGYPSINAYPLMYKPQPLNSSLIKIEIGKSDLTGSRYVVPIILINFGDEYYEVARLYYFYKP
ncbi:MAG: hypothetical protein QXM48_01540 [Sulfolobales archaeon]